MKRILFITSNRLGDAVISSGVLNEVIARQPRARITVVCGPVAASYFEPCPAVERVIVLEKRRFDLHWADLWRRCVLRWWDIVIDLRGSGISFFLPCGTRRIMRGGRRPGARIGQLSSVFPDTPILRPACWSRPGQMRLAEAILPQGKRYLALAPTANWDGKIWPADRFVALAEALDAQGLQPVVFYGPGASEHARARAVLDALPDALDLGGDHPLGLVAAFLRRCTLFVGNDSGLMHLAAATGIATLGLFGPSRVSEYAPCGSRARSVVAPGPEGEAPIAGLSTAQVIASACALLRDEG